MSEFLINFLATLSADAILAIALYYIITQPGEKKKERELEIATLGLIKAELMINETRAKNYLRELDQIIKSLKRPRNNYRKMNISNYFPLRFTRGAWNALREGGFLPNINEPILAYSLFTVNELFVVANRTLRRFELVTLGNEDGDPKVFAAIAKKDVEKLYEVLTSTLAAMKDVKVSETANNPLFLQELDENRSQSHNLEP